ncbi:hypothetical protein D9758_006464 [Tetrapyrgos nigripes]|uniref:Uncharacterized protein n=1 Tax=Tetrapyrgos nigripes TaxID=182062 RepID=A0A8H5GKU9_9AGAR|nr:hypothetical protein D9758_006464 [Tetrapyrgos nigripes]
MASSPKHHGHQHSDDDSLVGSPTSPLSPVNTITQDTFGQAHGSRARIYSSPERYRLDSGFPGAGHMSTLNRVPEDGSVEFDFGRVPAEAIDDDEGEDWDVDQELEAQGLYRGSYRTSVILYTFAPLTSLLGFVLFAILPLVLSPADETLYPYPYTHLIPFPIPELLVSVSLYSFAHILRQPIYSLSQILLSGLLSLFSSLWHRLWRWRRQTSHLDVHSNSNLFSSALITIFSAIIHTLISAGLRVAAFPILLITDVGFVKPDSVSSSSREDAPTYSYSYSLFLRVWWVALGWALVEAVIGIVQGYEGIALYKDVLVDVDENGNPNNSNSLRRRDLDLDLEGGEGAGGERRRTDSSAFIDGGDGNGNGKGKGKLAKIYGTFTKSRNGRTQQQQQQAESQTQTQTHTQTQTQTQRQTQSPQLPPPHSRDNSKNSQNSQSNKSPSLENVPYNNDIHDPDRSPTAPASDEAEPLLGRKRSDIELPYLPNLSLSAFSLSHIHSLNGINNLNPENCSNLDQSLELQVNQDLDSLLLLRSRDELENVYGIAFVKIPVFISCLQRVNSLLASLGVMLLLGRAYLALASSHGGHGHGHGDEPDYDYMRLLRAFYSSRPSISPSSSSSFLSLYTSPLSSPFPSPTTILTPTLILLIVLSLLHTPLLLPRLGVHTVVYIGALLSLGTLFAGLGVWGVLV